MRELTTAARTTRYRALTGLDAMLNDNIAIAGVGAVGRQIALTLATMGANNLTIYDHDTVEEENLGPQGYDPGSLGSPKVMAMALDISRRNPECALSPIQGKYPEMQIEDHHTLFVCVDSMQSRMDIAQETTLAEFTGKVVPSPTCPDDPHQIVQSPIRQPIFRLIDTRMACMAGRLITDRDPYDNWRRTLFTDEEAAVEPCSLRMTTFGAQIMAGFAVHEYMALLQGRTPIDLHIDIMARALIKDPDYIIEPDFAHEALAEES